MKVLTISLILATTLFVSCGKDNVYVTNNTTTLPAATPTLTPEDQDIQNLIDDENDYRLNQGQSILSKGLSCSLETVTSGDRIQSSIAGHNQFSGLSGVGNFLMTESFNQENSSVNVGMSVLPASLRNTYKTNYFLRCQGSIVITDSDTYSFGLVSDDASVLYIDGQKVIDNDNAHSVTSLTGVKNLRRGVHSIRLEYAQNSGSQALILKMNDELLSPALYVH